MSTSTSHRRGSRTHQRGAHGGGGGSHGGDDEGGGGGGGGGGDGSRLVKIAFARTEPEAELIQGLLAEADIPSVLHRIPLGAGGYYMPGPVNVMVAAEAAPRARQVLAETFVESEDQERLELEEERRLARGETGIVSPGKLAFWILTIAIAAFILLWLLYQATT
jgi:hypothetical protein